MYEYNPEAVVVYGDTNTTLAALAAAKEYIPLVHIEAGVRCGNRRMPEEINRTLIDNMSNFLACPSDLAVSNLRSEGVTGVVENIGDFMYDTFVKAQVAAKTASFDLNTYGVIEGQYYLATLHREETTASPDVLRLFWIRLTPWISVILPMHPRTRSVMDAACISTEMFNGLKIIEPVGYLEMVNLLVRARLTLTDSGGLQKGKFLGRCPVYHTYERDNLV